MPTLTINDERLGREKVKALTLECLTESLTVRELIRQRVYQEVQDYNQKLEESNNKPLPKLLVTPTDEEAQLNAKPSQIAPNRSKRKKKISWETQFDLACRAFDSNGFFVIIGDRQAEALDEAFQVAVDTEITFVKLVPLVGG
ncbi:hypothetical protein [Rubellicoccus peritrichatus]|uniref:Uncharacterized protein n=1 Tax=Rubellicoccus peritrichatus TaxID=3080537 RepID=A0AAQ3L824_9BACT|nr:hypothetical protein [Puniceicoccus sp. CR14]WOO39624.1 hypothetical protein RZN69_13450 [Puniceicoccus sp. CR14]